VIGALTSAAEGAGVETPRKGFRRTTDGMECGNASYRSDCFCSCSNPWLVQARLVARAEADLLAFQDE
jgi:hypothetical protein